MKGTESDPYIVKLTYAQLRSLEAAVEYTKRFYASGIIPVSEAEEALLEQAHNALEKALDV